eukprot:3914979-Rhodomonas_salina.1
MSESVSYVASAMPFGNTMVGGNRSVTLVGAGLGIFGSSSRFRAGVTGCEASQWLSDSSVFALVANGVGQTLRLAVTVGARTASISDAVSFDAGVASSLLTSNTIAAGARRVWYYGGMFGNVDASHRTILGFSACEATVWSSTSSVLAINPAGIAFLRQIGVTAGTKAGSLTQVFTYNNPVVSRLETSNGDDTQWPTTTLPDRWAGTRTGGNVLTLTGENFGTRDYSMVVSIGNKTCAQTNWTSDYTTSCLVPSVEGWGELAQNDTTCQNSEACLVNHAVGITHNISEQDSSLTTDTNLSYVYACQCDEVQCYIHDYVQGGPSAYCMDVDECNATLCDGTTCPQNDCDTNASCTNTNGSFTCACSPGFSGNSTVGTTCLRCAAGKYKTEFSNSDCTHCGTFSPAGSITFSDCDAPAFRFLFDEDPPPAP